MTKILHISASPRGEHSESLALAATFLDTVQQQRPDVEIDHWDLWDGTLPDFGPAAAEAKMAVFSGADPEGPAAAAWQAARAAFERLDEADHYLFSIPMWNHTVPYIVKQLIDVVSQPGMLFTFDPAAGYTGLLTGKKAVVLYTGAVWGPGRPGAFGHDFLSPYFEDWLRWAGVTDVSSVHFQPNLAADDVESRRSVARAETAALAGHFLRRQAA
jgi:FMN-dependent NADH-azoreductase